MNSGSQYSNYDTLIAWGIPALQTVAVLVARFVDADELLGETELFYCVFLVCQTGCLRREVHFH